MPPPAPVWPKTPKAVQAALKILSTALTLGRARHQGPDFPYFGYQSLALVIPRSATFFSVVAPDLIAFDQPRIHLKDPAHSPSATSSTCTTYPAAPQTC